MKIFLVGGAVRDKLLGLVPKDSDFLVIGATEQEMKLQGFNKVGLAHPVFLHPRTFDEYTIAADLHEDLKRRDLTINSMAMDSEGTLIDIFDGKKDLENKILRHTSEESFFSDPLRIYRVARFQAQFPCFTIASETKKLIIELGKTQAFLEVSPDRIVKELARSFETIKPSLFFRTLQSLDCLSVHFTELSHGTIEKWNSLDSISQKGFDRSLIFAALLKDLSLDDLKAMTQRFPLENSWIEVARAYIIYQQEKRPWEAETLVDFFYRIDAFRKPHMVTAIGNLDASESMNLQKSFEIVQNVTISQIDPSEKGKAIGEAIRKVRIKKLRELF